MKDMIKVGIGCLVIGAVAFDIAYLLPTGHPIKMIFGVGGAILIGIALLTWQGQGSPQMRPPPTII